MVTLGYRHSSAAQVAFTASQRFEIAGIVLEPITARNAPSVYNPAGIASNALAAFEIEVYPTTIPDDDITWSIAYGDLSFYNTGNRGRIVYVRGGTTEGDFKLEVDIANMTLDPKPYIYGKTLALRSIALYVFNICDTNGVLAVNPGTITQWVETANAIYKQAGMGFYIAHLLTITNQDWLVIDDNNFYGLTSYTNYTGGLELYCVKKIIGAYGFHSDNTISYGKQGRGMAVREDAFMQTLAHEIGHACGLSDINDSTLGGGLVSEEKTGILNWSGGNGTGYYSQNQLYEDLVARTIMSNIGGALRWDISFDGLTIMIGTNREPIRVGLKQINFWDIKH